LNEPSSLLSSSRIAFIGAGNMAGSLIGGLVAKGLAPAQITASDPLETARNSITEIYGVFASANNHQVVSEAGVVILAVKPQVMKTVVQDMVPALKKDVLVISIAAGISLQNLERWLGKDTAIVRCMPNTPALVQLGATGMFANRCVSASQKQLAQNILDAVGISLWLGSEEELDAVTALSGSGPAYYFLLMEAMIQAGIALGLSAETSRLLTLQTALGAATMASRSNDEPADLRRKVTSPKGTTEQAILSFRQNGFERMVAEAMRAAEKRSISLSEELGKD